MRNILKYSIIIPTLNEEVLLPKLLKQLTDKELRNRYQFEIIISDGGSTDKTLEIARHSADKVVIKQSSGTQNIAMGRNIGTKSASGEILIFLNGDVVLNDAFYFFDYLQHQFNESNYLAFTCFVWIYPDEEKFADKTFHSIYNIYFWLLNFIGVGMGRGECQVIRKDIFTTVGGYNEECAAGEDFELFKRIRKMGEILFSKKVFVYESARRFRRYGYFRVTLSWILNSFSVILKNRSMHSEWEQVR